MRFDEFRLRDELALHTVIFDEKDKIAKVGFCKIDQFFHFLEVGLASEKDIEVDSLRLQFPIRVAIFEEQLGSMFAVSEREALPYLCSYRFRERFSHRLASRRWTNGILCESPISPSHCPAV